MTTPISRDALRERIAAEHARLEQLLAPLTEEQMTRPGIAGAWSIKDVLAHLSFWEQRMAQAIERARRGEPPEPRPASEAAWVREIDRINSRAFDANRDRPLNEVLAGFDQSYQQVLAMVDSLSDLDLAGATRLVKALGRPLLPLIAGDTYEHYREHAESIRAGLTQQDTGDEIGDLDRLDDSGDVDELADLDRLDN